MDKVKASELLLEILSEIKHLKEALALQNFQYNLILKKLNELSIEPSQKFISTVKNDEIKQKESLLVRATEKLPIGELKATETIPQVSDIGSYFSQEIGNGLKQTGLADDDEQFSFTEIEDEVLVKKGLAQKVPITQLIYTEDNKPVSIATIEIFDKEGNVVKTKTNSVGRWSALVFPGEHLIKVKRRYGKSVLEFEQTINVGDTTKQTEILPPEKYRKKK